MADYLIIFVSADGEEREEHWGSVEAFRTWAAAQDTAYAFTAFRADDEGEWEVVEKGRLGGG